MCKQCIVSLKNHGSNSNKEGKMDVKIMLIYENKNYKQHF